MTARMAVKLAGLLAGWSKKESKFFFGQNLNSFLKTNSKKIQKIFNLVPPRQRAYQIDFFQKILNLVPPWSPEAYIPSLRTLAYSGLGGTNLKIFRKFSNRCGVSGEQTGSEIAPTQIWPKIGIHILKCHNSLSAIVTFHDTRIFDTVLTWSTF